MKLADNFVSFSVAEQHPFEKLKKTITINGKDYVYFDLKDLGDEYRKLVAYNC